MLIEKILSIIGGSVDNLDEKKFLREMLAKHFPDWEARVSIENQEARIYYKATRRLKEYTFVKNPWKLANGWRKVCDKLFSWNGGLRKISRS